ncbi:MAG: sugar phosphate isomerase/epimerase [Chloroflexota bacterium]|nr:MAG: sugar phosphate isomerase/epimerase [Chloroflexota bacterium]
MKLCYALRRGVYFPSQKDNFGEMPDRQHRAKYLKVVKAAGFDGVEVPIGGALRGDASDGAAEDFGAELRDAGLPVVCVRGGGPVAHPKEGPTVRARMKAVVQYAAAVGASVVNSTIVTPATLPDGPGAERRGESTSQGASRYASEADFVETARHLRDIGKQCGDLGIKLSIEIHQGSVADNSWSGLKLLDLIGLENVGVNPDLGNIFWQFDEPEETNEHAIVALATRSTYWHCKNLKKVYYPQLRKAIFLRVPLEDGDIDYRFAVSAMVAAGYSGYMSIEGANTGDQLSQDARSAAYARRLLREATA